MPKAGVSASFRLRSVNFLCGVGYPTLGAISSAGLKEGMWVSGTRVDMNFRRSAKKPTTAWAELFIYMVCQLSMGLADRTSA